MYEKKTNKKTKHDNLLSTNSHTNNDFLLDVNSFEEELYINDKVYYDAGPEELLIKDKEKKKREEDKFLEKVDNIITLSKNKAAAHDVFEKFAKHMNQMKEIVDNKNLEFGEHTYVNYHHLMNLIQNYVEDTTLLTMENVNKIKLITPEQNLSDCLGDEDDEFCRTEFLIKEAMRVMNAADTLDLLNNTYYGFGIVTNEQWSNYFKEYKLIKNFIQKYIQNHENISAETMTKIEFIDPVKIHDKEDIDDTCWKASFIIGKSAFILNKDELLDLLYTVKIDNIELTNQQWSNYFNNYDEYKDMPISWWKELV